MRNTPQLLVIHGRLDSFTHLYESLLLTERCKGRELFISSCREVYIVVLVVLLAFFAVADNVKAAVTAVEYNKILYLE